MTINLKWIDIKDRLPPSFFDVWVMNGKIKRRAYWDNPLKIWYQPTSNIWDNRQFYQVTAWAIIPDFTFDMQIEADRKIKDLRDKQKYLPETRVSKALNEYFERCKTYRNQMQKKNFIL